LTSTSTSANNIHAFIENGNDDVIEHVHTLVAQLVVKCKAPLSLATNVNLNKVIQAIVIPEARVVRSNDARQDQLRTHLHVLQVHHVR